MPTINEIIAAHRRDLLNGERASAKRQIDAYEIAWRGIREELHSLLARYVSATEDAGGEDIGVEWLLERRDRLDALLEQAGAKIAEFAARAGIEITLQQQRAIHAARRDSKQLALFQAPPRLQCHLSASWKQFPDDALGNLVATLANGSPLRSRLAKLAPNGVEAIRSAMIQGVALGKGPKDIARDVRQAAAIPLRSALTISRTEVMRAYREASTASYRANSDVVQGWIWVASLTSRSCALCIAMNGTEHPITEVLASHVCCRCTQCPKTKSWAELGVPGGEDLEDTRPTFEAGETWLKRQDRKTQIAVLGKSAAIAWRSGEVSLSDFVGYRDDPTWGPTRYVRSLKEATASVGI